MRVVLSIESKVICVFFGKRINYSLKVDKNLYYSFNRLKTEFKQIIDIKNYINVLYMVDNIKRYLDPK
jgi:hypothetical protein